MIRRILICLTLATCCFLNTWVELGQGQGVYYARYDPLHTVVIPVLAWEAVLTLAGLGIWEALNRWRASPIVSGVFIAASLIPFGIASVAGLRLLPARFTPMARTSIFLPVALCLAVAALAFCVLRPRFSARIVRTVFLYSLPVLSLIIFQGIRRTLWPYPRSAYSDQPLAAAFAAPSSSNRLVWIIFDELSQQIAFGNRPPRLSLPNLDHLRARSFYASSASAPGNSTEISIPGLTVGERVIEAAPQGPDRLLLRTQEHPEWRSWGSIPNVFDDARSAGYNTALVGWFHPYGRVLARSLNRCFWMAGWLLSGIEERAETQALGTAMWDRARLQFAVLPLLGHLPGVFPGIYHRDEKVLRLGMLMEQARHIVADPSIGLALIHLPVPHPPATYSRSAGVMDTRARVGYIDSVSLADRILGELEQCIAAAGLEQRTALLVSADHGWRTHLWRGDAEWTAEDEAASHQDTSGVPFLVRLPAQQAGLTYPRPVDTVVTRRVIMAILQGGLTDPSRIAELVEKTNNPGIPESEHSDRRTLVDVRQ